MSNESQLPTWLRERIEADCTAEGEYEEYRNGVWAGAEACCRALLEAGPVFDEEAALNAPGTRNENSLASFARGARWQHEQDRAALGLMQAECDELKEELNEQARVNGMGSEREAKLMAEVARLRSALEAVVRESSFFQSDVIKLTREALLSENTD